MRASFIIGFHTARKDNLLQTLRFLELWHPEITSDCELITVCQNSLDFELPVSTWEKHSNYDLNLTEMSLPFVTNFGVDKSVCDRIVVLESDRILSSKYFDDVFTHLQEGIQMTNENTIKFLQDRPDQIIERHSYNFARYKIEPRSKTNEMGMRNMWSGNTAFIKSDFYKAGKMDESYVGYGWADSDMTSSMENIGVKSVFLNYNEFHLHHEPMTYGQVDQKQLFINNGLRYCIKWKKPIPLFLKEEINKHMGTII